MLVQAIAVSLFTLNVYIAGAVSLFSLNLYIAGRFQGRLHSAPPTIRTVWIPKSIGPLCSWNRSPQHRLILQILQRWDRYIQEVSNTFLRQVQACSDVVQMFCYFSRSFIQTACSHIMLFQSRFQIYCYFSPSHVYMCKNNAFSVVILIIIDR